MISMHFITTFLGVWHDLLAIGNVYHTSQCNPFSMGTTIMRIKPVLRLTHFCHIQKQNNHGVGVQFLVSRQTLGLSENVLSTLITRIW